MQLNRQQIETLEQDGYLTIVYLSLCHVDNHIRQFKRPEWVAHRDFTPIEPLPDDTLRELIA